LRSTSRYLEVSGVLVAMFAFAVRRGFGYRIACHTVVNG
jgi:hypothetical protein